MIKRAIMLISVVLLLFVGLAIPAPAGGAAEPAAPLPLWTEWDGPTVLGVYTVKCNIKFYDWTCQKAFIIKEAEWEIKQEELGLGYGPKIMCMFTLKGIPEGWGLPSPLYYWVSVVGYVGPFVRNPQDRITNSPRLSHWVGEGTFCEYSNNPIKRYETWVINAKVKVDRKTGNVKSIKGSIYGWGEFGYPIPPPVAPGAPVGFYVPRLGQFEGKFTATPVL
jgi:hypothetical protein